MIRRRRLSLGSHQSQARPGGGPPLSDDALDRQTVPLPGGDAGESVL